MERRSQADSHQFFVGSIVGFQALAGEVKVKPSTNNPDLLLDLKTLRVELAKGMMPLGGQPEPVLTVRSIRLDRRMLVVAFKGLNDRNAVEHMEGAKLYCVEAELLPLQEEEFWVTDLVGMNVVTTGGAEVGKVVSVISAGNDLLEIEPVGGAGGKTILVPFVKDMVPVVDAKKKRIEVVDLPGLLEPQ